MSYDDRSYLIDGEQLRRLDTVAKRLFTENRMNGDEMRDAAQTIEAVTRVVRNFPIEDEEKR